MQTVEKAATGSMQEKVEQLKKRRERLKRAMVSAGPPRSDDARTPPLLLLSSATGAGVTEALRALLTVIDNERTQERQRVETAEWRP